MWNVFNSNVRNNNQVESWHRRLNRTVGMTHPNVYRLLDTAETRTYLDRADRQDKTSYRVAVNISRAPPDRCQNMLRGKRRWTPSSPSSLRCCVRWEVSDVGHLLHRVLCGVACVERWATLDTFFTEFFAVLRVLRGERTHGYIMRRNQNSGDTRRCADSWWQGLHWPRHPLRFRTDPQAAGTKGFGEAGSRWKWTVRDVRGPHRRYRDVVALFVLDHAEDAM